MSFHNSVKTARFFWVHVGDTAHAGRAHDEDTQHTAQGESIKSMPGKERPKKDKQPSQEITQRTDLRYVTLELTIPLYCTSSLHYHVLPCNLRQGGQGTRTLTDMESFPPRG